MSPHRTGRRRAHRFVAGGVPLAVIAALASAGPAVGAGDLDGDAHVVRTATLGDIPLGRFSNARSTARAGWSTAVWRLPWSTCGCLTGSDRGVELTARVRGRGRGGTRACRPIDRAAPAWPRLRQLVRE